jgi:hypothetical protein
MAETAAVMSVEAEARHRQEEQERRAKRKVSASNDRRSDSRVIHLVDGAVGISGDGN